MAQRIAKFQNLLLRSELFLSKRQRAVSISQLLASIWPTKTELPLIRIGSETRADGGYLVPDDLDGIKRVFSPGVSYKMDFEEHFLEMGIPCEMIDGSVNGLPRTHKLANFKKLWLAASTTDEKISLDDWVHTASKPSEELLLQMDIEGAEYEVLLASSQSTLDRFRIIVLELHDLRSVMSRMGLTLFQSTLRRLTTSHLIVHAHPNNCCRGIIESGQEWPDVLELTLLRRDRFSEDLGPAPLPHPFDKNNGPGRAITLKRAGD